MTEGESVFDVNKLINALDNDDNERFMTLNKQIIQKEKNDVLQKLQLEREDLKTLHKKLKQYRYVDDLADLKYGSYIRWMRLTDPENLYLTNGGIVVDINIYDTGVQIKCKNNYNRFFNIKIDECIIFQKLSQQELILLQIMEALNK